MTIKFFNDAYGVLKQDISESDTRIPIYNRNIGDPFSYPYLGQGGYCYATLSDSDNNLEIVKITRVDRDYAVLTVERAQEGTTARGYSAGDKIEHRITAQSLNGIVDSFARHEYRDIRRFKSLSNTEAISSAASGNHSYFNPTLRTSIDYACNITLIYDITLQADSDSVAQAREFRIDLRPNVNVLYSSSHPIHTYSSDYVYMSGIVTLS